MAQDVLARSWLDAMPGRERLGARLKELMRAPQDVEVRHADGHVHGGRHRRELRPAHLPEIAGTEWVIVQRAAEHSRGDECIELGVSWRRDYERIGAFQKGSTFAVRLALKGLGR